MPAEYSSGAHDKPAWHGMGHVFGRSFNTEEALRESGLNFRVIKEQAIRLVDGVEIPVPGRYWNVREDSNAVLGGVGEKYTIVQNAQAFEFVDFLIGEEGFHYTQAVSLRGGSIVALTAKAPFALDLPTSKGELYVVLMNSHDGSESLQAMATPVQVVCMNTLRSALSAKQASVKLRHTLHIPDRMHEAQRVLGLAQGAADLISKRAEELFKKKMSEKRFGEFLEKLVPVSNPGSQLSETRTYNTRREIRDIYFGTEYGQPDMLGTEWGAYNAAVVHNDWVQGGKTTRTSTSAESVFERIMSGQNLGSKALELLSK